MMKIIKIWQIISQIEIANEFGVSSHVLKMTQKKHAYNGSVLDMKTTGSNI